MSEQYSRNISRQDLIAPRTASQLERQYNFGKAFNEVLGVVSDARIIAEEAKKAATEIAETNNGIALRVNSLEKGLSGQFQLTIEEAEDGETGEKKVFSLIDGEATEIHFKSNSLIIESDYFNLDREGKIYATGGRIGNCYFDDEGDFVVPTSCFAEKITADKINADGIVATDVDITGKITATEGLIGDCEIVNGTLATRFLSAYDEATGHYTIVSSEGIDLRSNNCDVEIDSAGMRIDDETKKRKTNITPGRIELRNTETEAIAFMNFEMDGVDVWGTWVFSEVLRVGGSFYVGSTLLTESNLKALLRLL